MLTENALRSGLVDAVRVTAHNVSETQVMGGLLTAVGDLARTHAVISKRKVSSLTALHQAVIEIRRR